MMTTMTMAKDLGVLPPPPIFCVFLFIQTFTSKMSLQTSPETRFGHSLGAMLRHLAQTLAERWTPMSQHGPQERQEEPT